MAKNNKKQENKRIKSLESQLSATQTQLAEVLSYLKPEKTTLLPENEPQPEQEPAIVAVTRPEEPKTEENITETAPEPVNLNPHATSWEITPSMYTPENKMVTFFNEKEEPLTHLEITPPIVGSLVEKLNQEITYLGENPIDQWYIRTPEDPNVPPLLHLASNGAIIASLELDRELMKELMPLLLKIYNPVKRKQRVMNWLKTHRIVSGALLIFFSTIVIYTIITYYF